MIDLNKVSTSNSNASNVFEVLLNKEKGFQPQLKEHFNF
jgi:hypothetical protein